MKKSFIAIVLGGILALQVNAAPIYNLYNAHRAMRVDDILTVVIIESAKAGSQSGTTPRKQNDLSLTALTAPDY